MSPPDFHALVIGPRAALREAVQAIDRGGSMITLVVDAGGKLLGTVTDGDVRRGLLRGLTLESPVDQVMHKTPVTAAPGTPREDLLSLMHKQRISQVPLVDGKGVVVGLELLVDLLQAAAPRKNPVVILAGGFGRRLLPLTESTPKPMLPVGGRPILELLIQRLAAQGFQEFHIAVHYREESIEAHLGDGAALGVRIEYVHEPAPLGTAGALRLISERLLQPALVLNGDLLTTVNARHMLDFHLAGGQQITMAVKEYSHQVPYGVVSLDGGMIVEIREKPTQTSFINAGIYVLDPSAVSLIPAGEPSDMPGLIQAALSKGGRVAAFPIHEYWIDIGRRSDYERAQGDAAGGV